MTLRIDSDEFFWTSNIKVMAQLMARIKYSLTKDKKQESVRKRWQWLSGLAFHSIRERERERERERTRILQVIEWEQACQTANWVFCVCVCANWVCVCVCVCEREREREREKSKAAGMKSSSSSNPQYNPLGHIACLLITLQTLPKLPDTFFFPFPYYSLYIICYANSKMDPFLQVLGHAC